MKSRIDDETKRTAKRLFRFLLHTLNEPTSPQRDEKAVSGIAEFLHQQYRLGSKSSVGFANNLLETYGKERAASRFKMFIEAAESDVVLGAKNLPKEDKWELL